MKILHINTAYATTGLYKNLVSELAENNVEQIIYSPIRSKREYEKNKVISEKIFFVYSLILNNYTRINYFHKIRKIYKDILQKINLSDISCVHTHFLFSDGGVAYLLQKNFKIDYIVAVRNTDINIFYKYFFFLRPFALKILLNAKKVVLISPSYERYLFKYIPKKHHEEIRKKIEVLPNGIDGFWLKNSLESNKKFDSGNITMLYIGQFNKNKNIERIIETFFVLSKKGLPVKLILVGKRNDDYIIKNDRILIYEWTNDKNKLKEYYKNADIFIMPSHKETFGLVYIEAMSQGLPVIYTEGQGIDGYFKKNTIGVAVTSRNTFTIVDGVEFIINNYQTMTNECVKAARDFCWTDIASRYIKIYSEIKNKMYIQ